MSPYLFYPLPSYGECLSPVIFTSIQISPYVIKHKEPINPNTSQESSSFSPRMLKLVFNNRKANEYRIKSPMFRSLFHSSSNFILNLCPLEVRIWIQTAIFILSYLKDTTVLLNTQNRHLSISIYNLINNKR